MVLRMKVKDVKQSGRATRGFRLMEVKEGDKVASIARTATAELKKAGANIGGEPVPGAGMQFELPIK
jgi:DNA gyrase/topoisomerase IV subunit A